MVATATIYDNDRLGDSVLLAGERIIFQGAASEDIMEFKRASTISIRLDGSDRRVAETEYGVFNQSVYDNGYIYYEGWTNVEAFPRPIYRLTPDFTTQVKAGDIDGSLLTVKNGIFYYLGTAREGASAGIHIQLLEEGAASFLYKNRDYSSKDYNCLDTDIAEDGKNMTARLRSKADYITMVTKRFPLIPEEKASSPPDRWIGKK